MILERNKALARRAIEEVWSKGNLQVAPEVYGSSFVSHQHSHPHDINSGILVKRRPIQSVVNTVQKILTRLSCQPKGSPLPF
jgi:hypothetical protein